MTSILETRYVEDVDTKRRQKYVLARFPQTDRELWLWVYATFGVKIPVRAVCPGHVAPFRAFADAYFARSPISVWKASRGLGGKTFLLSLLGMTEMVTLGVFLTILGGSGAQSQRVHESMKEFWEAPNAPLYMLQHQTQFNTYLTNGAKARTLTASQSSVRGPHPQRLRMDEIDEMDLPILQAAQGQPMKSRRLPAVNTQTVMSSTHQYPDGTMTYALNYAKERGFPIYHWCFRETSAMGGWLTPEEIERKKSEISADMWATEFELQEPSFEGRAIMTAQVDICFNAALGTATGEQGLEYFFELPNTTHSYVTGVDWAKDRDWTIIATFDTTDPDKWRCVAWLRTGRLPWPMMVKRANLRITKYGGKFIHDSTGVGNVVKDLLDLPPSLSSETDYIDQTIGGTFRKNMLSEYIAAIETCKIEYPRIEFAYNEHRYAVNNDIYGTGHLPDSICAGALAWSMRNQHSVVAGTPAVHGEGLDRARSPWKI